MGIIANHLRPIWLDLGCGRGKLPGFIGVDRFPMPGVDVIADLDGRLPFPDDAIDLVYASHSLEHVRDLSGVIREVYRVCKHGAQLYIVAPYYNQAGNLANPYHLQVFNEHTPRFWTASAATPIELADFIHPHARTWGLIESDSRRADIDIRCVRMEFFYFPEYRNLSVEQQRWHRKHESDVCDQLVYHLLVIKRPITDKEFFQMTEEMQPYDSPYVAVRRLQEQCERLESAHQEALAQKEKIAADYQALARCKDQVEAELHEQRQRMAEMTSGWGWKVVQALRRVRMGLQGG